jgi:hypothetical protein
MYCTVLVFKCVLCSIICLCVFVCMWCCSIVFVYVCVYRVQYFAVLLSVRDSSLTDDRRGFFGFCHNSDFVATELIVLVTVCE